MVLIGVLILLYIAPTVIALVREHRQIPAIFALNLLLGWTIVGWVAALVWALIVSESPRAHPVRDAPAARPSPDGPTLQEIAAGRAFAAPRAAPKSRSATVGLGPVAVAAIATAVAAVAVGAYVLVEQSAKPPPYIYDGNPANNADASSFHPGEAPAPAAQPKHRRHRRTVASD